jgi:hypothetical protein
MIDLYLENSQTLLEGKMVPEEREPIKRSLWRPSLMILMLPKLPKLRQETQMDNQQLVKIKIKVIKITTMNMITNMTTNMITNMIMITTTSMSMSMIMNIRKVKNF